MRLHASGDAGLVKVLERSHGRGGSRRGTLEDIFQIVIMIDVQPRTARTFLERFSWPLTKRYSPLVYVLSANPQ